MRTRLVAAALGGTLALGAGAAAPGGPASKPSTVGDVLRLTDTIAARVAALRELPLVTPIDKSLITRADARTLFAEHAAKDRTKDEIAAEGALLVKLGLMPAGTGYWELVLDLLAEQVAGFYDTDRRKLFLADWLGPDPVALAHEITHALADQHFDLRRWEARMATSSDFALAFSAVAEGDAVASMIDYGLDGKRRFTDIPGIVDSMRGEYESGAAKPAGAVSDSPRFDAAPAVLRKSLLFPYLDGFAFIDVMRRRGPWADVDDLYLHPPASTEQILHPAKFFAHEAPLDVPVPTAPALEAGAHVVLDDVLGEFQLSAILAEHLPPASARAAAAGWAGDRLAVFAPRDAVLHDPATPDDLAGLVVVHRLAFDDSAEAAEAARALSAFDATLPLAAGAARVERRGRTLLWLVGVPSALRARVLAQLWAAWPGPPDARR